MAPLVPSCSHAPVALLGPFWCLRCCAGAAGAANWGRVERATLGPAMLKMCSATHRHTPFCVVRGIIACGSVCSHLITLSCVPACCVGAVIASYVRGSVPHLCTSIPPTGDIPVDKVMPSDAHETSIQGPHEKCTDERFPSWSTAAFVIANFIFSPFL